MIFRHNSINPNVIIQGTQTCPSGNAIPVIATATPIYKGVDIWVRSLATSGSYVAIGSSAGQPRQLTTIGANIYVDWADDLNDVYVICDASSNAVIEYLGA